jgi:hypothetical protein
LFAGSGTGKRQPPRAPLKKRSPQITFRTTNLAANRLITRAVDRGAPFRRCQALDSGTPWLIAAQYPVPMITTPPRLSSFRASSSAAAVARALWLTALISNCALPGALAAPAKAKDRPAEFDLEGSFNGKVRPFVETYCVDCHSGESPKGDFDLSAFSTAAKVIADHDAWERVLEKLETGEMPSEKAKKFPSDPLRQEMVEWIQTMRKTEARRHAGDPGIVLARRLSNAEYNYTIRDLTGVDIRPTREFPVDPANPAGFDNSGESLAMSPALMTKYLQAAREVANHLVVKPTGLAFAPHPMLVETDRDKYCVNQIVDFYHRQDTDYADYFRAAWRYKHRAKLGQSKATLAEIAAAAKVSPKYLATIWRALEETKEEVGPLAKLQTMWRALPAPSGKDRNVPDLAPRCEQLRDFVVQLRAKLEPRFPNLAVKGIAGTAEPFLMWKNRQYASHRMSYDREVLQIDGQVKTDPTAVQKPKMSVAAADAVDEDAMPADAPRRQAADPDLTVPSADRARYEAAFARFCAIFPDAFYVSERGRNYLDKTKDRGRLLSAGFHNIMGYFRDDQPLCELVLDDAGKKELDELWQELDFVASATSRTYVQFYLNESGEARKVEKGATSETDKQITSPASIHRVAESYLTRAKASGNPVAVQAIEEHFQWVDTTLRSVDQARAEAESRHLAALQDFAARAYRRPLTPGEREELNAFYRSLRNDSGLSHEEAIRDSVVSMLMYPDFCYRVDLVDAGPGVRPLSDHALASRLSYFLWSSMPDAELLAHAAAGDLHRPDVLAGQARRMLKDERVRGLAAEFGGNWLDFRRFEEHNAVDRERFSTFNNELRSAMFEEPLRFMLDVFRENRSVLEFIYGDYTFVNPVLAKHYGMPEPKAGPNDWVRVDHARQYDRGGLLPMAVFLTKNAPGLRTSPVKRGYWVVKRVLGEHIPPPPAVVPELPRDEAKLDLPLRDMLARHRQDKSCASCHARFDAMGLVFEGFGPVGERRTLDLAGHPVDAHAVFPGGAEGTGLDGLRAYIRDRRQGDFVDNLCRKLLAYALGRSLMLSDDPTIEAMRAKLAANDYRFDTLVESIVTSPQFLTKRGPEGLTMKGD